MSRLNKLLTAADAQVTDTATTAHASIKELQDKITALIENKQIIAHLFMERRASAVLSKWRTTRSKFHSWIQEFRCIIETNWKQAATELDNALIDRRGVPVRPGAR